MSRRAADALCLALAVLALPVSAAAQAPDDAPSLRRHRVSLNGGVSLTGGYPIGDANAELRGNAVGPTAPPFGLFRAESSVKRSSGAELRVGYGVARNLVIEVGAAFSAPGIRTALSQDAETADVTLQSEQLSEYLVDVGATWQLPRPVINRRLRPFLSGGVGYLRQLYDERTLVETGQVYYGGGGVRYWLRGGAGARGSLGLRGDVRATWRHDGVEFEGKTRLWPTVAVLLFWEP